jgi:hypothetical protein
MIFGFFSFFVFYLWPPCAHYFYLAQAHALWSQFYMLPADRRTRTFDEWQRVVEDWCDGEGRYRPNTIPPYTNPDPGPEFHDGSRGPGTFLSWSAAKPLGRGTTFSGAAARAALHDAAEGAWSRAQELWGELSASLPQNLRQATLSGSSGWHAPTAPLPLFSVPRYVRVPLGRR